jgi:hypothetical protein
VGDQIFLSLFGSVAIGDEAYKIDAGGFISRNPKGVAGTDADHRDQLAFIFHFLEMPYRLPLLGDGIKFASAPFAIL